MGSGPLGKQLEIIILGGKEKQQPILCHQEKMQTEIVLHYDKPGLVGQCSETIYWQKNSTMENEGQRCTSTKVFCFLFLLFLNICLGFNSSLKINISIYTDKGIFIDLKM